MKTALFYFLLIISPTPSFAADGSQAREGEYTDLIAELERFNGDREVTAETEKRL